MMMFSWSLVPQGIWLVAQCAFYGYAEGLGGATCFSRMTGNLHIEFKHSMGPSWMAGTLMLLRYGRGAGVQGVGMAGMVAFLELGVSGQPVDALGNFPPFWYVNARAGADTLLWERGVNPNHLLGCTARLIEARGDPRYSRFTSLLMADFEVATGGDLGRALVCEREQQDVWQLERISPEGLGTVDSLPVPAEEENLVERVRREHFNTFLVLPALQRRLHGLEPNTQGAVEATSDGPLTRALGEWMLDAIDFLRDERARGEDGWAVHLLRGRMLGRGDQRYRGLAIEVLAGLDDVVPAGFIQTVEPPEYLVDWARDVEGELYELLHYRFQGACGSDATSFVQREVKQKDVPAPSTPDPRPLTLDEAADIWSIILGLALDEEVDAQPGVIVGEFTRNSVTETFLGYGAQDRLTLVLAFQGVVGRLLRMIGMIVEDALTEERSGPDWSPPEGDGDGDDTSLMQSALVTTDNDWYLFLADFRNALEHMTKEARLANSQVIWRWLDHRVTDSLSGRCLGHARGRAGEVLALLVAAMESSAGFLAGEHHLGVCTAWFQRLALFVPTVPGSRRDRGLPVSQELPAPVLFQKPLPLESDSDDAEETANRRLMRTNRQSERDLDALVEEERRDRAELVEHSEAMEAMQAAAEEEEAAETQRLADDFLEEEGGLRDLSPASYRAWEDRVFKRALQGPPTRKRAYLDVELASASSDAPRVSRRWRVPLPQSGVAFSLTATVVHEEDIVDTPPAAVAGGIGVTVPGPLAADVALTAEGTAAEGTDTDVDTVLVPGSGVPVTTQLDVGELCSTSEVAGEPGFNDGDRFQFTDLSMEQFQQLYGQWMGGLVSTGEVQATHGCEVAEMLELQCVAEQGGFESQA
ncbi:Top3b [Symbiodinium sp. CCMP2592]|nr:Top3b [Symbiodinium sp. CCMP2592]